MATTERVGRTPKNAQLAPRIAEARHAGPACLPALDARSQRLNLSVPVGPRPGSAGKVCPYRPVSCSLATRRQSL